MLDGSCAPSSGPVTQLLPVVPEKAPSGFSDDPRAATVPKKIRFVTRLSQTDLLWADRHQRTPARVDRSRHGIQSADTGPHLRPLY